MDQFLIRFIQGHESFRLPEIEALGTLNNCKVKTMRYSAESPFCVVQFENGHDQNFESIAKKFESRSILSRSIYELWGEGQTYDQLHQDVRRRSEPLWDHYRHVSFKFSVDTYCNTRSPSEQREIINSFSYLGFEGKIMLKNPDVEFCVFEDWTITDTAVSPTQDAADMIINKNNHKTSRTLNHVFLGRKISDSSRYLIEKHDLKKRPYISTTSMDAELALVTANLALAAPGKLFLDPFVGTGGFLVAAAELGAAVLGSDIDGRSFRGKGDGIWHGVGANFRRYGLENLFGDCITSDITNSPFRSSRMNAQSCNGRWLDGIICDPPYGVREGLKVLGLRTYDLESVDDILENLDNSRKSNSREPVLIDGVPAYTLTGYIAPKKPYSFKRMLDDILVFASQNLVDHGRLAFWMPSANEDQYGQEEVTVIPQHQVLELKHECVQRFNRWSRRLLVYERIPASLGGDHSLDGLTSKIEFSQSNGQNADDLNPFRKRYFQAFSDKSSK